MLSQAVLLSVLMALINNAEARFGQEQTPIAAIGAVTSGGSPGVAATLAGSAISTLLGAADPCLKLSKADDIITQLGTGADAVAAAKGLVAAEQNFNPFATKIPAICGDASLPKTEILRGIVPLVDPAVVGADVENANSKKSLETPFENAGLSVAQIMAAQGFTSLVAKGGAAGAGAAAPAGGAAPSKVASKSVNAVATPAPVADAAATTCGPATVTVTVTEGADAGAGGAAATAAPVVAAPVASGAPAAPAASGAPAAPAAGGAAAGTKSSIAGLDFGSCVPTMDFVGGRNGRKATEFTFLPTDAAVKAGQQEALNPNIITNRICDQLTNVCKANDAAKAACTAQKAAITALGTRDQTTADAWNKGLGF